MTAVERWGLDDGAACWDETGGVGIVATTLRFLDGLSPANAGSACRTGLVIGDRS